MARAGWALASLVALPLLAGCMSPGDAVPDAEPIVEAGLTVPPTSLVAGTFYAFRHAGGSLGLGVLPGGRAQVELFNGQDQRLGQFSLSDALADGRLELRDMPAGDYVIRMLAVNGTLLIASGGAAPALRPLAAHVERHVLAQTDEEAIPPVPSLGVPGSAPVEERVDLQLLRSPTSLHVLVSGDYASLDVELRSTLGPVLAVHAPGSFPFSFSSGGGLFDLGGEFHGENVRDGHLTGLVRTTDLHGAVVLEAASFSRAEPVAPPTAPADAPPRFTYGVLPDSPVRFQTGPRATTLLLHGNAFPEGNRTWVTLFDDHGHRIGTLAVRSGGTVAVPVAASTGYIAV
ncbi:MAG: hypothetical protein LC623_01620, partial [Halobacteriales archaeon]|nr:hypothetical protein [Halobacteriales archaeon]